MKRLISIALLLAVCVTCLTAFVSTNAMTIDNKDEVTPASTYTYAPAGALVLNINTHVSPADAPKERFEFSVALSEDDVHNIVIDGEGTASYTVENTDNMIEVVIKEVKGSSENWTYDDTVYTVNFAEKLTDMVIHRYAVLHKNGEQVGEPMLIDEDGCTIELDFTNTYTATVPHTGSASIMIASAALVTLGSTIATVRTRKESLKQ